MLEICTSHYKEDLKWLLESEFKICVVHKEGGDTLDFEPDYIIPNVGDEVTAYLKFIIERYDTLPEHTVFLHGHETAYHQHGDRHMLEMIRTANIKKYGFLDINNTWDGSSPNETSPILGMGHLFTNNSLREMLSPFPDIIITCLASQFIVSKENILRNSKEFYKKLYETVKTKYDGYLMEYAWHKIFTGTWNFIPRKEHFNPPLKGDDIPLAVDRYQPLFLKDLKFGYVGRNPPNHDMVVHITSKEMYDEFYEQPCIPFVLGNDQIMNIEFDEKKTWKIWRLPSLDFIPYLIQLVKRKEDLFTSLMSQDV